ncbi:MAG: TraB/GumN family protein [Desulfobacterales bacterium]|nr:TraB/GumN family protein [Desulfobacterales bacterium]
MGMNHIFRKNRHQSLCIGVLLAFVWTFASIVHAQEISEVKTNKNFLWSIETEKNTMYLLGAVHILKSDSFPLSKGIQDAYGACKKIVFETDTDGMEDPAFQVKMMTLGLYSDGETLEQNVSEQTYASLKKKAVAAGLSMAQLDRFRPWLCAVTLTAIELQRLGFDPNYGIDMYFFDKAKKDGKETIFLETVEYQLKAFTEMAEREEESFLRQTLKDLEVIETMFSDIVESWKTGDVDKLESIMKISFKDHPDIYHRLVTQRNKEWITKIENLMKQDDNVLVIVGAGHLAGTENILELLKKKGHKIRQR